MGCPMCHLADQLAVDIPLVEHKYIRAYYVGVTTPEWDIGGDAGVTAPKTPDPTGIRCLHCRWSYTGPNCLQRLVVLEPTR